MSTIKVDTIKDTNNVEVYTAKAWVNFDGTTATIRSDGNVTSIIDNGTGNFTVNFTNAMTDNNYSYCINGWKSAAYSPHADIYFGASSYSTYVTTSSIQIGFAGTSGFTVSDPNVMSVVIFR